MKNSKMRKSGLRVFTMLGKTNRKRSIMWSSNRMWQFCTDPEKKVGEGESLTFLQSGKEHPQDV